MSRLQHIRDREPERSDTALEREVCQSLYEDICGEGLKGVGPKQARNIVQFLGLTRFETPLDSRITKWLNQNLELPYRVTGGGLSAPEFYQFTMDLVQDACAGAGVLPCVFDAAVFTSYDEDA